MRLQVRPDGATPKSPRSAHPGLVYWSSGVQGPDLQQKPRARMGVSRDRRGFPPPRKPPGSFSGPQLGVEQQSWPNF